jgi:hypothetical protein
MQRYLTLMQQDLYSAKLSQSKIWTFESKFIGTMPLQKESINAAENKKDQEYRLIDGYHRCSSTNNKTIQLIVAI